MSNVINYEEKTKEQLRADFLINMYNQAFNNINRHIIIVWQTISILAASFVSIFLAEKFEVSIWITSFLLIIYITWMIAHLIDANHWFKRNLHIITNIEKNFLNKDDLKLIHPYINMDIKYEKIIESFYIQIIFAIVIWILMLVFLFYKATLTNSLDLFMFHFTITIICWIILTMYQESNKKKIKLLITQSPGKELV